jgi:hypothetical protein
MEMIQMSKHELIKKYKFIELVKSLRNNVSNKEAEALWEKHQDELNERLYDLAETFVETLTIK